jgi:hypothetical protein
VVFLRQRHNERYIATALQYSEFSSQRCKVQSSFSQSESDYTRPKVIKYEYVGLKNCRTPKNLKAHW